MYILPCSALSKSSFNAIIVMSTKKKLCYQFKYSGMLKTAACFIYNIFKGMAISWSRGWGNRD